MMTKLTCWTIYLSLAINIIKLMVILLTIPYNPYYFQRAIEILMTLKLEIINIQITCRV